MDREIRYVRNKGAQVEKISVAGVINDLVKVPNTEGQAEGAAVAVGYSQEDLDRFSDLIKGVIGFDETRGDTVKIIAIPFDEPELIEEASIPWYSNDQILNLIKIIFGSLAFIAIIFFVVRPAMKSYSNFSLAAKAMGGKDGELTAAELNMLSSGNSGSINDIRAKLKPKKSGLSADMLNTANTYDDKVALVRLLVAEDAGRVANVLKKMTRPA
jgi:flagellar M-ring protein FliF